MPKDDDCPYDTAETARRRDEVIKRMLNIPPQPHRPKQKPGTGTGKAGSKGTG
jgi:hypothetical protein